MFVGVNPRGWDGGGSMKFIDICAGIGGFRLGFERAGHECIGYVEFDKFARASYEAMYDTTGEWTAWDVTKLTPEEIPYADCWTFGFPCQDISVAGKMKGIKNGTRSGIFYDIIRLLKGKSPKDRPKWLVIENVKNLLSIDAGGGYTEVLCEMAEAGYDAEWQVCNSKDFGVPQNRERVYIVGYLRERCAGGILPVTGANSKIGLEILGKANKDIHSLTDIHSTGGLIATLASRNYKGPKMIATGPKNHQQDRVYSGNGVSPTLNTIPGGGHVVKIIDDTQGFDGTRIYENITPTLRAERCGLKILEATKKGYAEAVPGDSINVQFQGSTTRRGRVQKQSAGTLETACNQGPLEKDGRIRYLTPREYYRLQGFPDNLFNKASSVNSKTQLYKQAGNAVTVNVAEAIGHKIAEVEHDN